VQHRRHLSWWELLQLRLHHNRPGGHR
jgi:hypothetical protein